MIVLILLSACVPAPPADTDEPDDPCADCRIGEVCEAGACVEAACADTHVDCDAGQVCAGGACEPADVCAPCTSACAAGQTCSWFFGQSQEYCYASCTENVDCAAGFTCASDGAGGGICYADCDWLVAEGWI